MKTQTLLLMLVATFFLCGCDTKETKPTTPPQQNTTAAAQVAASQPATRKVVFTCTMDPDVISDKPGKCPKCGMALVEKK